MKAFMPRKLNESQFYTNEPEHGFAIFLLHVKIYNGFVY